MLSFSCSLTLKMDMLNFTIGDFKRLTLKIGD